MLNSNATVPNPQYEYAIADTFTVELIVTASNGCIDTVSHPIIIRPGHTFYAPTAFTPNTGLKNNYFYPKGIGVDPNNYHLYIYDRWGQIVFETTVYPEGTADVLPIVSYPNTFRRNLIDFAVKIAIKPKSGWI